MNIDANQEGFAYAIIESTNPQWIDPICSLSNWPDIKISCNYSGGNLYTKILDEKTWHTIRFEIDPNTTMLRIYVDNTLGITDNFKDSLGSGDPQYNLILSTMTGSKSKVIGMFDDVRISPAP